VLADFRRWLQQAAVPVSAPSPAEVEPLDLHTLLAQFVALRHEVNLQTKATRAQQEQNTNTLQQLSQALETLRQTQVRDQQAQQQTEDEAIRPLLRVLVDARDALALASREVLRVKETGLPVVNQPPVPQARPSFWARLFGGRSTPPEPPPDGQAMEQVRKLLDAILTGYTMSLQRLERALGQCGLEAIACVGQTFDPERMEVVAIVTDGARPAGEVVEEVRRGYLWRGRVFRYAQVSVAKA
jgi:molecular chaperone GrpE